MVKRGEIWQANLTPSKKGAASAPILCVIVSPDVLNEHLPTVTIAPMSSQALPAPFRVMMTHAGTRGQIVLDQLHSIHKSQLIAKQGAIRSTTSGEVFSILTEMFSA